MIRGLLFILRHILGCASSPTFLRLSFAYSSLILRSSFGVGISKNMGEKILLIFCFELIIYYLCKKKITYGHNQNKV